LPIMTSVAIVNGIHRMKRYNKHLGSLYKSIGVESVKEYKFNPYVLFCCHMHGRLDQEIEKILSEHDVIHCQSSGFFRLLPYCKEKGLMDSTPVILESPVLKSHTGTLYAALNWSDSYKSAPQNPLVNAFLDTVCFTPSYKQQTLDTVEKEHRAGRVLSLTSTADGVCDIEGLEDSHFDRIFETGKHARLFASDANEQDFGLVEDFLKRRLPV